MLKDGDHIGVLVAGDAEDDLQTEADKEAAEAFAVQKAEAQKKKEEKAREKRFVNDHVGVRI